MKLHCKQQNKNSNILTISNVLLMFGMSKSTLKYIDSMPEEARQFYFKKFEVIVANQQPSVLPDPYRPTVASPSE